MQEHLHIWATPTESESGWLVRCEDNKCGAWWATPFKPVGDPVRIYEKINGRDMVRDFSKSTTKN